jgi:DNA polymerase-3 subunit epsilon
MLARDAEMTVLDFETTGSVEGYPVEAWQLGMVRIRKGHIEAKPVFNELLQVGDRPFNPHAPGKHHSLREELRLAPTMTDLWSTLKLWWIGVPLVAHNTGTEQKFVKQTAPVHRVGPWIDTLKLARLAYPNLPSHGLDHVIASLGLTDELKQFTGDLEAHDALYDAFASAVLLLHVLDLPGWESVTVDDLALAKPTDYYRKKL